MNARGKGVEPVWFERAAAIPGFDYTPLSEVDRAGLAHRDSTPVIETDDSLSYLVWPTPQLGQWDRGRTSPARLTLESFRTNLLADTQSTPALLLAIASALELPGVAVDYHHALERGQYALWRRAYREPETLALVDRLGMTDLSLAVACLPQVQVALNTHVLARGEAGHSWASVSDVIARIVELHATEGRLQCALTIADVGRSLGTGSNLVDDLTARLSRLGVDPRAFAETR